MGDQEIERVYLNHRAAFKAWARKNFGLDENDALDVYQEATMAFVRNVRSGKLDPSLGEPSTYLFAIGRNLALKHLRQRKHVVGDPTLRIEPTTPAEPEELAQQEHALHLVNTGMAQLTEKEQQVLRLYYFEERSMAEIACIMGYSGAEVAKKTKYIGFRKLAALLGRTFTPKSVTHAE